MKTAFAFELRVVTCVECGAPVEIGSAGGALACAYCRSPQRAQASSRAIPRSPAMLEAQRLAVLGRQDRLPLTVPADLAELFVGVELVPWKMGEALSTWRRLRELVMASGAPEHEDRLHRLTLALAEHFAEEGDPLRERSLLESALDASRTPRFRQSLCGALSRSACRLGDTVAAEAWLSLCDPCSSDLVADSAWRYARATLDTALGRFPAVLSLLGASGAQIPLDDRHEPNCTVLRANALERLEHLQAAEQALDEYFQRASAYQRYLCSSFIADSGFCARSAPRVEARQRERGLQAAGKASGAPRFALGMALGSFVLGALVGLPLALFGVWGGAHFAFGMGGLLGVVFGVLGVSELGKWRRARRLRTSGIATVARVVHARGTGQWTMGIPQLLYRLLVLPRGGVPFLAQAMFHADEAMRTRFGPGALAIVRVDPSEQHFVQLELD